MFYTKGPFIRVKIRRVLNKTQTVQHKRHISSEIRRDIDVFRATYTSKNKTQTVPYKRRISSEIRRALAKSRLI